MRESVGTSRVSLALLLCRSLSVKRRFDQHPLLWQLLLFSVHSESHSLSSTIH